ncbi:Ig-like domain repeat protein [Aeromicrobium sp. P5_D10]
MIRTIPRRGAIGAIAGFMMLAALSAPGEATTALPTDKSGGIIGWGDPTFNTAFTAPEALHDTAFSATSAQGSFSVALTAAGKVVILGESQTPGISIQDLPAALVNKTATAVSSSSDNAAVVTSDGGLYVWGRDDDSTTGPWDVPAGLTGVEDVALAASFGVAVKTDGSVVAWGDNTYGQTTVPAGLTGVKSLALTESAVYALKTDGTVVAWGRDVEGQLTLPSTVTTAGNVVDIAARPQGGLALLADGSLASWGQDTSGFFNGNAVPSTVAAALAINPAVAIATSFSGNAVVDSTGALHTWGPYVPTEIATAPAQLAGSQVKQLKMGDLSYAIAITTGVKVGTTAKITGAPKVGQTLTATPATFSGTPDSVTGQWLAGGVEIEGATGTTLELTSAHLGKAITYASTATKGAAAPLISISTPTAAVTPNVIASSTVLSAPSRAYGSTGTATVTVTNAGGLPVTGTVTVSGAGATQTKAVVGGKASFSLAKTLAPKAYTLTARYNGSAQLSPSARAIKYTVVKGKVRSVSYKTTKTPTSKKKGKATVTVTAPSGLAKATGKVTVTLKKGSSKKTIKATLSGGKKSITLPKLKKGTWKVTVSYAGDSRYTSAKSKTYTLKVKK